MDRADRQDALALRISDRNRAHPGARARGSRRRAGRPQRARPAPVVAGRTERLSRHQCGMGRARGHEAAPRHRLAGRLAHEQQHRSARAARTRSGGRRIGRDAPHHRARGDAAAGDGDPADVAGIPEEMTMDCGCASLVTSRRALLLGGASFAAWAYLPKFARAADGRDPRLVVVILRGALDGLATVAPIGDPDYAALHGSIALAANGPHAAVMLDSFFGLHPSMPEFARMYQNKQAAVIHAVSTPYRDRSHFDGQD